jgi:L-rhamnose-H+ transport protein
MGAVWLGGYALYGVSTTMLGSFGTTAGWIVFFAMTVLTGNVMGVVTGEWKGTSGAAQRWMTFGILLLLCAIFVVGIGSAKAQ